MIPIDTFTLLMDFNHLKEVKVDRCDQNSRVLRKRYMSFEKEMSSFLALSTNKFGLVYFLLL